MTHVYADDIVAKALQQDPLAEAEKIVGESYKTNKTALAIGFDLQARKGAAVKQMLQSGNDTYFGCPLDYFEQVLADIGAERVLQVPFHSERWGYDDTLNVWWGDGILYEYDTYNGSVNGGKFYYNWRPQVGITDRWECTSSGHMTKSGVWIGDHDIREAVKLTIRRFKERGELLTKWEECPRLWLLHYEDEHQISGQDWNVRSAFYDKVCHERMAMLPENVRQAMGAK
jgi:hypothetical protein